MDIASGEVLKAGKSVQDYIDETPSWADGTPASSAPLTPMQWRVWILAAAGKLFEGMVIFTTGVALPLIGQEFTMSPLQHGMVGAASLFGILIGAIALGGLSDLLGRKLVFIAEMIIFMVFLALLSVSQGLPWMILSMVGVGLALLRLSDGPSHNLRKHPQPGAWKTGARRLRLPGGRRAGRHHHRLRHSQQFP